MGFVECVVRVLHVCSGLGTCAAGLVPKTRLGCQHLIDNFLPAARDQVAQASFALDDVLPVIGTFGGLCAPVAVLLLRRSLPLPAGCESRSAFPPAACADDRLPR